MSRFLVVLGMEWANRIGPTPLITMIDYRVRLDGDLKALKQLDRAILRAAKTTCIAVANEAVPNVIQAIQATFVVRGTWYLPSGKYGIHVRYTKNAEDLSANVETLADWLEEHETGGDRHTDKHDGRLTIAHAARPGGYGSASKVPAANKARRVLPNASLLDSRQLIKTSARRSTGQGKRFSFKPVPFFMNKEGTIIFERLPEHRLAIYYTLSPTVHIQHQSTVIAPTFATVELRFGPIYNLKLAETIEFRKQ